MAKRLIAIRYKYSYVDTPESEYEDIVYMRENQFINYIDDDVCRKIVETFMDETDHSRILKSIVEINRLGYRLI